uniref:LapA family protein n=1 Tax=Candidatus Electrothrix sp. TaxID=2170559 RepID=UPI004055F51E
MEELTTLTEYPFLFGLVIGLIAALVFWVRSVLKTQKLNKEIKKLREHLHTKFEIESEDNERRKGELTQVRQERDNLRNMIQVLNQKPSKQEIRQTQIYQKAIETMFEKSPGFAPAWQITLKEAEEEMRNAEKGILPFFKRMTGSSPASYSASSAEEKKPRNRHLELEDPDNL